LEKDNKDDMAIIEKLKENNEKLIKFISEKGKK